MLRTILEPLSSESKMVDKRFEDIKRGTMDPTGRAEYPQANLTVYRYETDGGLFVLVGHAGLNAPIDVWRKVFRSAAEREAYVDQTVSRIELYQRVQRRLEALNGTIRVHDVLHTTDPIRFYQVVALVGDQAVVREMDSREVDGVQTPVRGKFLGDQFGGLIRMVDGVAGVEVAPGTHAFVAGRPDLEEAVRMSKQAGFDYVVRLVHVSFVGNKSFNRNTIDDIENLYVEMPEGVVGLKVRGVKYSPPLTYQQEKLGSVRETVFSVAYPEGFMQEAVKLIKNYGKKNKFAVELLDRPRDPMTVQRRMAAERAARFHEGPEGEAEFEAWFNEQPESFQEDWEANTEEYGDQFKQASRSTRWRCLPNPKNPLALPVYLLEGYTYTERNQYTGAETPVTRTFRIFASPQGTWGVDYYDMNHYVAMGLDGYRTPEQAAQALTQEVAAGKAPSARFAARNDPYWMTAKFPGKDSKGRSFPKGTRVFYYPLTKTILTGEEAEKASREFSAARDDEDFFGR